MVNTADAGDPERLVLFGSFTAVPATSRCFLSLSGLPFSFRTVNLKNGVQKLPDYLAVNRYGQVPALRHRGLTMVQSNVILDYLARATGLRGDDRAGALDGAGMAILGMDAVTNVAKVRHYSRFRAVDPAVMDYFRPLAEAALGFVDDAMADAGNGWWGGNTEHRRYRLLGPHGLHGGRRAGHRALAASAAVGERLAALPGFALPYDLIPKKDAEFPGR